MRSISINQIRVLTEDAYKIGLQKINNKLHPPPCALDAVVSSLENHSKETNDNCKQRGSLYQGGSKNHVATDIV